MPAPGTGGPVRAVHHPPRRRHRRPPFTHPIEEIHGPVPQPARSSTSRTALPHVAAHLSGGHLSVRPRHGLGGGLRGPGHRGRRPGGGQGPCSRGDGRGHAGRRVRVGAHQRHHHPALGEGPGGADRGPQPAGHRAGQDRAPGPHHQDRHDEPRGHPRGRAHRVRRGSHERLRHRPGSRGVPSGLRRGGLPQGHRRLGGSHGPRVRALHPGHGVPRGGAAGAHRRAEQRCVRGRARGGVQGHPVHGHDRQAVPGPGPDRRDQPRAGAERPGDPVGAGDDRAGELGTRGSGRFLPPRLARAKKVSELAETYGLWNS